jgi:hypothetical protein
MAKAKKTIVRREWSKEDVRQMKTMAKAKAGVFVARINFDRFEPEPVVFIGRVGGLVACIAPPIIRDHFVELIRTPIQTLQCRRWHGRGSNESVDPLHGIPSSAGA